MSKETKKSQPVSSEKTQIDIETARARKEEVLAAAKKREADFVAFSKSVPQMSHKQLTADLRRRSNQAYGPINGKAGIINGVDFSDVKKRSRAGLDNIEAIVNLIVLENTKIAERLDNGQLRRKDQLGFGKLNSYPL
jgi:hypothetical protein